MSELIVQVKVSAGAKTDHIEELLPGIFKVRVHEPPERGKANAGVARLLAQHFKVPMSQVFLVSGATSRDKKFLIDL